MLKSRTPMQIRQDAIKMGLKKAQNGCPECADAYFELARQHGASEQEILTALEQATGLQQKGLSRRALIKYAVAGAGGLAVAGTLVFSLEHLGGASASTTFSFGVDSNTTNCCQMPFHFYIGHMGYGIYPDTYYFAFNTTMAKQAGHTSTFGYWGVQGPGENPGYSSAQAWGVAQGQAAWKAWNGSFVGSDLVGGLTVFGDVEAGFGGWGTDVAANQAVINGFLNQLFTVTPAEVWPGLYISPDFWDEYLGSSFKPSTPFVLWINGASTCSVCDPCNEACSTTVSDAQNTFLKEVRSLTLGGQQPILWQYWLTNPGCNNSGCGDWNIATQLARSLVPASH